MLDEHNVRHLHIHSNYMMGGTYSTHLREMLTAVKSKS